MAITNRIQQIQKIPFPSTLLLQLQFGASQWLQQFSQQLQHVQHSFSPMQKVVNKQMQKYNITKLKIIIDLV